MQEVSFAVCNTFDKLFTHRLAGTGGHPDFVLAAESKDASILRDLAQKLQALQWSVLGCSFGFR